MEHDDIKENVAFEDGEGVTYVTLHPKYAVGDPYKTSVIRQDIISISKSKRSSYLYHGKEGTERVKAPGRKMFVEREGELEVPNVRAYRGVSHKPNLYSAFGNYAYDYEVKIGVDPSEMHNGAETTLPYYDLFAILSSYGFDPLFPFKIPKIKERFEYQLGAFIYKEIKNAKKGKNMNHAISAWALLPRDYIRDYIRGSISGVPKNPLADATIERREKRANKISGLYKYGIGNALWETGELEGDISVLSVKAVARVLERRKSGEWTKKADAAMARERAIRQEIADAKTKERDERRKKKRTASAVATPNGVTRDILDALKTLVVMEREQLKTRLKGFAGAVLDSGEINPAMESSIKAHYPNEYGKYDRARDNYINHMLAANIADQADRME